MFLAIIFFFIFVAAALFIIAPFFKNDT